MPDKRAAMVSDVLTNYLERRKLRPRMQQASVIHDWEALVGVELARVTQPDSVDRDGTLRVRVQSAAWLQELQLMTPTIIAELAAQNRNIKRIWWILGTLTGDSGEAHGRQRRR